MRARPNPKRSATLIQIREPSPTPIASNGGFMLSLGESNYRRVYLASDGQTATFTNPGFWASAVDALRAWSN